LTVYQHITHITTGKGHGNLTWMTFRQHISSL